MNPTPSNSTTFRVSLPIPRLEFERLAALLAAGQHEDLEKAASLLCERYPNDGRSWQLLGVSFLARELNPRALPLLTRASELTPDNASIWDNLGLAYFRLREYSSADASFRRSTSLKPDQLTAWINWSANSCAAGDAVAAEQQARYALQINPNLAAAWLNFGNALVELSRLDEAENAFRHALKLQPEFAEAEVSFGMLLDKRGRQREALTYFHQVLERTPGNWRAYANLGKIYSALGESEWATANYRKALESNDAALEVFSGLLFLRLYEETADCRSVFRDHLNYGIRVEEPFRSAWPRHQNDRDANRRLRIGFVSGDFRHHPVAYFFEPILEALDRSGFEVFLYSNHPAEDAVSARLRRSADHWVTVVRMSDEQFATRIMSDGIDILVDLAGHSTYNRLPVFARKPAPVQVSWLGYPASTGMTAIDYRPIYAIADRERALGTQFSEKLVYLGCGPSFRQPPDTPEVSPLPAAERGVITFGSFNRSDKLGDAVIEVWSRILGELPGSRLIIGAVDNELVGQSLINRFARNGVSCDRLDLRPRVSMSEFLKFFQEIDILLDPFPFSGLTTSEHSVWMGVPVLTLAGESLVSRQGLVVMGGLGLESWVARDPSDYVRKAVGFARDLKGLAAVRSNLRTFAQGNSPWLEARCLEKAFRQMWRRWCEGRDPEAFEVTAG